MQYEIKILNAKVFNPQINLKYPLQSLTKKGGKVLKVISS